MWANGIFINYYYISFRRVSLLFYDFDMQEMQLCKAKRFVHWTHSSQMRCCKRIRAYTLMLAPMLQSLIFETWGISRAVSFGTSWFKMRYYLFCFFGVFIVFVLSFRKSITAMPTSTNFNKKKLKFRNEQNTVHGNAFRHNQHYSKNVAGENRLRDFPYHSDIYLRLHLMRIENDKKCKVKSFSTGCMWHTHVHRSPYSL